MAVDEQQVFADWEARGFSGGTMVDPPGKTWLGYVHAVDELIALIKEHGMWVSLPSGRDDEAVEG